MSFFVVRDQRTRVIAMRMAEPPTLAWVNAEESYYRMDEIAVTLDPDGPDRDRPALYLPHLSQPQLRIDDADFALNAFFLGIWFVSARMRAALDLADDEAVFRPAHVVGPTSIDYVAVAPLRHADAIDPESSDIEWFGEAGPSGRWELAIRDDKPPRVAFRPGFVAPAPLFYMDRTDWLMITADAAARVRSAGIDDVIFDRPGPTYGSWLTTG